MSPRNQAKSSLDRFRALVIRRFETLDARKANRAYDQLAALRREIYAAGEEESRRILRLLDDPHPAVRYQAAFDALTLDPERGIQVLRELANGPKGEIRLDARDTLEFYEGGTMDLQPWNKARAPDAESEGDDGRADDEEHDI